MGARADVAAFADVRAVLNHRIGPDCDVRAKLRATRNERRGVYSHGFQMIVVRGWLVYGVPLVACPPVRAYGER